MKSSTNVWCADHWSEQYLTEYHILEDWRKQSSTQNIPVEDWKKKCYPNYSHNVDDIKNQISHKLLPNLRVWESVRCESGVNDGMQLKVRLDYSMIINSNHKNDICLSYIFSFI